MTSVMSVTALDLPLRWAAVGSIRAYQRWLSPYKGFRCAHHALHRQGSCSNFGLGVFQAHPFGQAWGLLRQRFQECRHAYLVLAQSAGPMGSGSRPNQGPKPQGRPGDLVRAYACADVGASVGTSVGTLIAACGFSMCSG